VTLPAAQMSELVAASLREMKRVMEEGVKSSLWWLLLQFFNNQKNQENKDTVKPELAVTFIKQPTCIKQPNRMFPNLNFVLGGCLTQVWLYVMACVVISRGNSDMFR